MKRIEPVGQYPEDAGYPSLSDRILSRRGFFTAATAGAVALMGGGAALLPDNVEARRSRKPVKVVIPLFHQFSGCEYAVEKLVVYSRNWRLVAFLKNRAKRKGVKAALVLVLKKHKCADLDSAKRKAGMEPNLEAALAAHYRRVSKRRTARPKITVLITRTAPPGTDGIATPPSVPVPPLGG